MTDLVERLRAKTTYAFTQPTHRHMPKYSAGRELLKEAATALEAKNKEIAALRDENDALASIYAEISTLMGHRGTEEHSVADSIRAVIARAETAERELTREREAFQREQTLRDNGISSHSEAVVLVTTLRRVFDDILEELGCERDNEAALEAIATLRRERDEARAVLKPFADAADDLSDTHKDHMDIWEAPAAGSITAGNLRAARAVIEKE